MRYQGHNILAIVAAAAAMYAIGFLIYGVLFSAQRQAASGYTEESFAGQEWKMALSPVMPLLIAAGLSLAIKWRAQPGWMAGAVTGLIMALVFVFASRLYTFVYSPEAAAMLAIDSAHLFLISAAGGAIIGAWK
jgi:hypothetical protein